jgi:mono/diheme cytochrome c family protein
MSASAAVQITCRPRSYGNAWNSCRTGSHLIAAIGCFRAVEVGGTQEALILISPQRIFRCVALQSLGQRIRPPRRYGLGGHNDEDAADLFAFFYSSRYFDKPGDAARGKAAQPVEQSFQSNFAARHCADCHGVRESRAESALPVAKWESLGHPIVLVQQMWNYSGHMYAASERRKIAWQQLSTQELSDMLEYLRR